MPPPLPPMPSRAVVSNNQQLQNRNVDFLQLADLDLSSNFNSTSSNNNNLRNNNSNQTLIDFDMFDDLPKPLPPPRPNHFK